MTTFNVPRVRLLQLRVCLPCHRQSKHTRSQRASSIEITPRTRLDGTNTTESFELPRTLHPPLQIRKLTTSSGRPRYPSYIRAQHLHLRRASSDTEYPSSANSIERLRTLPHPLAHLCLGDVV